METNYLECKFCNQFFNTKERSPRMIFVCGHSICTACIAEKLTQNVSFQCPEDHTVINLVNKTLNDFQCNLVFMNLLKINETKSLQKLQNDLQHDSFQTNFEEKLHQKNQLNSQPTSSQLLVSSQSSYEPLKPIEHELSVSMASSERSHEQTCQTHKKTLEAVCLNSECQVRVCFECALFGPHTVN